MIIGICSVQLVNVGIYISHPKTPLLCFMVLEIYLHMGYFLFIYRRTFVVLRIFSAVTTFLFCRC
jgi:Na+/H+ antiporter NhaB